MLEFWPSFCRAENAVNSVRRWLKRAIVMLTRSTEILSRRARSLKASASSQERGVCSWEKLQ